MNITPKPKKLTHIQIIMNHLLSGKTISNMQGYKLYNITTVVRRISDLRAAGVPIQDVFIKRNGEKYKLYWINKTDRDKFCEVTQ
jgi:hypothetical protein